MNGGGPSGELHRASSLTRRVLLVLAALSTACQGGLSLDPAAWDERRREQGDAADVLDLDGSDVALDRGAATDGGEEMDVTRPDVSEEMDTSAPPDAPVDASNDATTEVDAGFDAVDATSPDSDEMRQDAGDDASDGTLDSADDTFDAPGEVGDGCTVACGWPDADYYVDAHAPSDGKGTRLEPFKTITLAIAAYNADSPDQPKTAYVAAGTYDVALGEQFPLVLRGLSLKGAGRDATVIVGTGTLDHSAEAGAFHDRYLVTIVAGDGALTTTLAGVTVRPESPVPTLNYYGVFCDRGSATGEVAPPAGQTVLDGVGIGPGYHASVVATTSTAPIVTGCNIVIRSSLLTGGWAGLRAYGCDPTRLSGPVLVEMGGDDPSKGNVISWMQATGDTAAGAFLEGCVLRASFQNNAFVDSVYGLSLGDKSVPIGTSAVRTVTIKSNAFERLRAGGIVSASNGLQIDELSDNRFIGISRAVTQDPGTRAVALSINLVRLGKVRRNQFIGNDFGVLLAVPTGSVGTAPDFGTDTDPGGNVFRCNSALKETGADLAFSGDPSNDPETNWSGTVHLAGNAWDHAPPTTRSDDPAPNGCDISTVRVPHVTLDVQNATLATPACPADRAPGQ